MIQIKFTLVCLLLLLLANHALTQNKIERWDHIEITLKGTQAGNPFAEVNLSAAFTHAGKSVVVDGFYDGEGTYKIRFMPDATGKWSYTTTSNRKELNGKKGSFTCVAASAENKGPVQVKNQYHFSYVNGEPYMPVGTTCYAWLHQYENLQKQTLETLKNSPFNKLRMTIFPKYYDYNRKEPTIYPYEKGKDGKWDFSTFNPAYFKSIEKRIQDLQELHIEADLILFHPYDQGHWGFDRMGREADHHYLKYIVARFAAFRNVWWSMANEFDLMEKKTAEDWESFFTVIGEKDPYQHLVSIHNGNIDVMYDHNKPHITHVSIQHPNLKEASSWKKFGKPVINDECEYEGNLAMPWGNISGKELVHRAWLGYGYGIYVGHGETFYDNLIWWSHGGVLKGESASRFDFLKKIMLETSPSGLNPFDLNNWMWLRFAAGKSDKAFIYYFAEHQPARWPFFQGEENKEYTADIIDTWNMTVTKLEGKYKKGSEIPLPGKPFMALRIWEVK